MSPWWLVLIIPGVVGLTLLGLFAVVIKLSKGIMG